MTGGELDQEPAELIWEGRPTWRSRFGFTILACLLVPLVIGIVMLIYQWIVLATTRYRLTTRRIEWEKGLFSRKIDGIDVWRIRHVEYYQSLGDRVAGVSRLQLYVQDQTEPQVVIRGLPAAREVYDKIAAAAQRVRRATVGLIS